MLYVTTALLLVGSSTGVLGLDTSNTVELDRRHHHKKHHHKLGGHQHDQKKDDEKKKITLHKQKKALEKPKPKMTDSDFVNDDNSHEEEVKLKIAQEGKHTAFKVNAGATKKYGPKPTM